VQDVVDVSPDPRAEGVASIDAVLSEPVILASFTHADLTLTRNGIPVALDGSVTVALLSGSTYRISGLGSFTAAPGDYTLTVRGDGLVDMAGNPGTGSASDSWAVTAAAPMTLRFDFGKTTSPVAPGYTQVTEKTRYDPTLGYGFTTLSIQTRDRGVGTDLTRDFAMVEVGRPMQFEADVPEGSYDVALTIGDATNPKPPMRIWIEGVAVDTVATAEGEFITRTYRVAVSDGRVTVLMQSTLSNGPVVLNVLEITAVSSSSTGAFRVSTDSLAPSLTDESSADVPVTLAAAGSANHRVTWWSPAGSAVRIAKSDKPDPHRLRGRWRRSAGEPNSVARFST
jgi:hypothetical protein